MKKEGMGRDENREKIKSARGIVTEFTFRRNEF